MMVSDGYARVLEEAKALAPSLVVPEGTVMGWPFRFMSTGKVYEYRAVSGAPVEKGCGFTEENMDDAMRIFHTYKYPINIDIDHNEDEPGGHVLTVWKTLDDSGAPALACIPAYGPDLARYVSRCNNILYSSPSVEWATEDRHFVDQETGERLGTFRINALALVVYPGQAPRRLDRVQLSRDQGAVPYKEELPGEENLPAGRNPVDFSLYVGDTTMEPHPPLEGQPEQGVTLDEQMLRKVLGEMLDERFATLMDHMITAPKPEDAVEAPEAPEDAVDEDEEKAALKAEIEALKKEKFSRECDAALVANGVPKGKTEIARRAWMAEFVTKQDLGYRPFTDVFKRTVQGERGANVSRPGAQTLHEVAQQFSREKGVSYTEGLQLAVSQFPHLIQEDK